MITVHKGLAKRVKVGTGNDNIPLHSLVKSIYMKTFKSRNIPAGVTINLINAGAPRIQNKTFAFPVN